MIEFNDSFSQAAVAEAVCAHSGLAKLINQQLMLPSFAYAHDVEGRRIGGPLVAIVAIMLSVGIIKLLGKSATVKKWLM